MESTMTEQETKAILDAVRNMNRKYKNKNNEHITGEEGIGPIKVYSVEFTGENEEQLSNYVVKRIGEEPIACVGLQEVSRELNSRLGLRAFVFANLQTIVFSLLAALLTIGLLVLYSIGSSDGLQPLVAVLTSVVGFIAGKHVTDRRDRWRPSREAMEM